MQIKVPAVLGIDIRVANICASVLLNGSRASFLQCIGGVQAWGAHHGKYRKV